MYRIFISHSWTYGDQYFRVEDFLKEQLGTFYNHSIPKDDPVHTNGTDRQLYVKIEDHILGCNCVVILAGVYSTYSKWINKEIEIAKKMGKPIIAVEPWGALRTSAVVKDAADITVGWNSKSIADAVRKFSK